MAQEHTINFELYKIFYITAVSGNITQAAEKLFLTQPSVSKHIRTLEEELECVLFKRSKRGVSLTGEGQQLFRRIEPACRLIFSAEQEIRSLQSLGEGTVSIASTEMSFKSYVLPAMVRFKKKHPNVKIRFSNALNEEIIAMLKDGIIDFAIIHEPFQKESFMELKLIEHMEEYVVCGERYKALSRTPVTPQELISFPFISMPRGSSTEAYLNRYFSDFGLDFQPEIELTTVELAVQAIESGLGIGTLPGRIAKPLIDQGRLLRIPVTEDFPRRDVFLISNRDILPAAAVRAFEEEMMKNENFEETGIY